jgi:HEAT repeat protein
MLGYAMALFAFMRRDERARWAAYLRPDARVAFRAGLRWLRRTGDSLFHPDTIHQGYRPPSVHEAAFRLRSGSPTVRLTTLWEIGQHRLESPGLVAAVVERLDDPDPAIPGEAARVLAGYGPAAEAAVPRLVQALSSVNDGTRIGAAYALGAIGAEPEVVIPELRILLGLGSRALVSAAVAALGQFGSRAEPAIGDLLGAFTSALVDCEHWLVDVVARSLLAITPDPERRVDEYFEEGDPELRWLALESLQQNRQPEDS